MHKVCSVLLFTVIFILTGFEIYFIASDSGIPGIIKVSTLTFLAEVASNFSNTKLSWPHHSVGDVIKRNFSVTSLDLHEVFKCFFLFLPSILLFCHELRENCMLKEARGELEALMKELEERHKKLVEEIEQDLEKYDNMWQRVIQMLRERHPLEAEVEISVLEREFQQLHLSIGYQFSCLARDVSLARREVHRQGDCPPAGHLQQRLNAIRHWIQKRTLIMRNQLLALESKIKMLENSRERPESFDSIIEQLSADITLLEAKFCVTQDE